MYGEVVRERPNQRPSGVLPRREQKARKHEMQLMQIIMSAQVQDSEHFPPQGNSLQYGYSYPSQHSYQYMESGNMAPNYINL